MTGLEAMIQRFVDKNVGVADETIFAGSSSYLPTHGKGFITILPTGGGRAIPTHESLTALRRPSFQVTARAADYLVADALIVKAYDASTLTPAELRAGLGQVIIGGLAFLSMYPEQEPFPLPDDASGRVRLAFNVSTLYRE